MIETKEIKRIGLIAGNGKLPFFVCQAAKEKGISVIVIGIKDELDLDLSKYASKIYWIELGQGKGLLDVLKNENLDYATMAGKIRKTTILRQSFKMDAIARDVLNKVINKGDNTVLQAVANRLKKENIQLLDSTKFLKDLLAQRGIYTKKHPSGAQKLDIDFGFKVAKKIAELDIGQTVIVKEKAIIAVEAIEGTDKAIIRSGQLNKDCVVVKVARSNHDMRFDVPTVGLTTIKSMTKASASVLVIEAGKTLVLEKEAMISEADEAGICIIAV